MLFTKKWKVAIFKISSVIKDQARHNILVSGALDSLDNQNVELSKRISELERRNRDNENIIEHLIELTKPLDKRTYKDENQTELKLRS